MSARGLRYDYCTYFNLLKPFATSLGRHKTIHIFRPCNFSLQTYLFAGHHSCSNENPKPEEQETHQGTSSISEDVSLLCKDGQLQEALDMWFVMDRQGFSTDCKTYSRLLQGCITKRALAQGNRVHAHIIQTRFEWSIIVYSNLINMYAKCGNLRDAQQLFEKMPEQDMISWNALISGYAHHGLYEEALKQFFKMQIEGMRPDQFTLASILSTCANIGNLEKGQQVHGCVIKSGWESQIFVGNALVDMYGKCGKIEAAHLLFDDNQEKDDVSWNALIAGYAQIGNGEEAIQLFCQMQRMGFKIGHFTLGSVLKVCGNVSFSEQGKQVHAYIIKSGHESNVFMISAILDMYAKCGRMDYSQQLFDEVPEQGEVLWNSLITGYAQNGHGEETLKHFFQMQWAGLKANHFTFGSVLKACSSVANPEHGKRIHSFIIKTGFESDILVGSAIVDMYAKCGVTEDARTMFYKMPERNVVTWNTIIAGFCQVVDAEEALNYFCEMQQTGIKPNHFTVSSVLRACTGIASLDYGRQVHAHIIKNSSDIDEFVGSSLVDMYAKCGAIDDACKWFEKMPKCDIVSWNTMVAGYAQNGLGEEASRLFHKVLTAGIKPDQSTFTSILSVSASIAALDQGKQVHAYTIKVGFEPWVVVGNALVGMYAKCGSIDEACNVFEEMPERDMISWTTLISGYAQHGRGKEALQIFEQMQDKGIKPNDITFVAVLSACSHVGLVDEGCHYFNSMTKDHGIAPRVDHYACVVDLLGRAGLLNEAENFIKKMKLKADAVMWRALLSACKIHGNVDIGQRAAEHILELEPHDASTYILLSNMYSLAGKWDDATRIRNMMKIEGVKKEPGLSWIEVSNAVHSFAVRDTSHPQTASIYAKLERLLKQMKEAGFGAQSYLRGMDNLCRKLDRLETESRNCPRPTGCSTTELRALFIPGTCSGSISSCGLLFQTPPFKPHIG